MKPNQKTYVDPAMGLIRLVRRKFETVESARTSEDLRRVLVIRPIQRGRKVGRLYGADFAIVASTVEQIHEAYERVSCLFGN